MLTRRHFLHSALASTALFLPRLAHAADWSAIEAEAKGQTVYFNAWAGSDTINAYIAWAGEEVKTRFRHHRRTCENHRHGRSGQTRAR